MGVMVVRSWGYRQADRVMVCYRGLLWVCMPQTRVFFFFFKQKTAYEIGTGDWSSDVCSSDLSNSNGYLHCATLPMLDDPSKVPGDVIMFR